MATKQTLTLNLPEELVAETKREALRQDRSLSWVLQMAWLMARDRIQLNSTARVNGDVVAEKLIGAEGASFNGRCCVGPEAVAEMRRILDVCCP